MGVEDQTIDKLKELNREEWKDLINGLVMEILRDQMAHPSQRAPVTEFRDPEGNSWVSITVPKKVAIRNIVGSLVATIGIIVGLVTWTNQWFLKPTIKDTAKEVFSELISDYVPDRQYVKDTTVNDGKWVAHDKAQEETNKLLGEMRQDIKDILREQR